MAAEGDETIVSELAAGASKSEEDFAKVGAALFKRKLERRPVIAHLQDDGSFFKGHETINANLHPHQVTPKEVSGDVVTGTQLAEKMSHGTVGNLSAKPMAAPQAMQEEAKLATPLYPMALFPAIAVVHHSDDSATSISLHNDEGQAPVIIHQSQLTVTGLTGDGQQETGSNTGFTELTAATLTTSMRSSSGGRVSTSTGPMEETFLTNEDLSEEDRNKAIVWAAAVQGAEHVGFLPECVLKTGFKIKKYKLWMPLEVCVDYTHKRLTLLFPDSVSNVLLRKVVAHRVDSGDIRVETPTSHKHQAAPGNRRSTNSNSRASNNSSHAPNFSRRRLNIIRTDGTGKYRIIAPTTEYRDRFLDILFMMTAPAQKPAPPEY